MTNADPRDVSVRTKLRALIRVARYRPSLTLAIVASGVFAAILEGVGLSFILPIVEIVQGAGDAAENADGVLLVFVRTYDILGVPFELGFVILGVALVLSIRWVATFFVRWLRSALVIDYTRDIRRRSFERALNARVAYFDREGSDDILNAIVTQSRHAGRAIKLVIKFVETAFLAAMYLVVAFVIAPVLTVFALVVLGGIAGIFRFIVDSGYELGDEVAEANEGVQRVTQAGTQGVRDTKLFGLKQELYDDFLEAVDRYANSKIVLRRNETALESFYNLLTAISVFALIYIALTFANLSLGALGVFLFAMFRLGPKASGLNSTFYQLENSLPHLVRAHRFIDELEANSEPLTDAEPVPHKVERVVFDDVRFTYEGQEEAAVRGISFEIEKGEFVGIVGQSGAGKSTVVSLLARMYEPDAGEIRANGKSIQEMDIDEWRDRVAVVRQNPYIFNETLRYNLTIGARDISEQMLDRVVRIAKVEEFFDDLPDGYETQLGDDGVRLSGGQRQRVALARALLKDSDILVLDEATSDLDSNLEKQVQGAIERMDRDYAMIGIAHRLSTVKNADRIHSMSDGRIVETGAHSELIENDGPYASLYAIQSQDRS